MEYFSSNSKGMTFIEILIVLAIISILFASFFYIWNTLDIFRKSRDSKRINDLQLLDTALKTILATEKNINLGQENIIYLSLPDSSSTCGSYNLITINSPFSYHCQPLTDYLKVDGNGWLPVNLTLGEILTISVLPVDPLNNKDYFYAYQVRNNRYKLSAKFESLANIIKMANDGGFEPTLYEVGSDLFIPSPHSGLVGYWSFDEGTSTIAYDLSGYGNNGTLLDASSTNADGNTPPQWTTGKIGKALSFDGVDDYVKVSGTENMINGLKTGTIEVWVKTPSTSATHRGIAGWQNDVNSDFYILHLANSDLLEMRARTASGGRDLNPSFAGFYDKWTHITFVRNRTILKAYINGIEVASRADMFDEAWNPSNPFMVGQQLTMYYNGLIDEVRIYNRALSDAEIKAFYEATK